MATILHVPEVTGTLRPLIAIPLNPKPYTLGPRAMRTAQDSPPLAAPTASEAGGRGGAKYRPRQLFQDTEESAKCQHDMHNDTPNFEADTETY